jgi:hypothetical protein
MVISLGRCGSRVGRTAHPARGLRGIDARNLGTIAKEKLNIPVFRRPSVKRLTFGTGSVVVSNEIC